MSNDDNGGGRYIYPSVDDPMTLVDRVYFFSQLFFSGFVMVDLSIVLISSNRANKIPSFAASVVFAEPKTIGSLSEAASKGEDKEDESNNAVLMDTDCFFILLN